MLKLYNIGAQKAGTSWLFTNLIRHPDISTSSIKEHHFWDIHRHKGIDWYKNQFNDPQLTELDFTPAYATLDDASIYECHYHFPHIKIIFIVRHPVARAWSALMMWLNQQQPHLKELPDKKTIMNFLNQPHVLARGSYYDTYSRWSRYYSPQQILVLDFEEMISMPLLSIKLCLDHIGLDWNSYPQHKIIHHKIHATACPIPIEKEYIDLINNQLADQWLEIQPYIHRLSYAASHS